MAIRGYTEMAMYRINWRRLVMEARAHNKDKAVVLKNEEEEKEEIIILYLTMFLP